MFVNNFADPEPFCVIVYASDTSLQRASISPTISRQLTGTATIAVMAASLVHEGRFHPLTPVQGVTFDPRHFVAPLRLAYNGADSGIILHLHVRRNLTASHRRYPHTTLHTCF